MLKQILPFIIFNLIFLSFIALADDLNISSHKATLDYKNNTITLEKDVKAETEDFLIEADLVQIFFNDKHQPLTLNIIGKITIINKKHKDTIIANEATYDFVSNKLQISGNIDYKTKNLPNLKLKSLEPK
jgi:lipopolysaccharide assembly outer membrane protein LptD (OstA)